MKLQLLFGAALVTKTGYGEEYEQPHILQFVNFCEGNSSPDCSKQLGMNCFFAAIVYAVFLGLCYVCWWSGKRKEAKRKALEARRRRQFAEDGQL